MPEGCEVVLEPVALSALRASLQRSSPLRQMVLDDMRDVAEALGRRPTLREWQRQSRYSLRTARTALGVDRWHHLLDAYFGDRDRSFRLKVTGHFGAS